MKALIQFHEATGDGRVLPALERALLKLAEVIAEQPLDSWAKMRWFELAIGIYWVYEHTGQEWLLDLMREIEQQGFDWQAHFAHFPCTEKAVEWRYENHVVNHAMAMKEPAIRYRLSPTPDAMLAIDRFIDTLDTYHGQATGLFTGDESLAGKDPAQGTELCAVVEYMYSLEYAISVFGAPNLADRLERIAFNALPATFSPDMWAHQYDQQANQVVCSSSDDRIYTTNGSDANLFGLEPNFGCCTANMHQGWPKFTTHLWMRTADDGLAAISYAPCTVATVVQGVPVRIEVQTDYPFEDTIRLVVTADRTVRFPLKLRIPAWTNAPVIEFAETGREVSEIAAFHTIEQEWQGQTVITLHLPMPIRTQTRYRQAVAIERGPLVYALAIGEEWTQVGGELPHADWAVYPTTPWNYALEIDRAHPETSLTFTTSPVGPCPFSPEGAPIRATVRGKRISNWTLEHNAAGPVPESPVSTDAPGEEVTLIPYGCTNLRVTEFPTLGDSVENY